MSGRSLRASAEGIQRAKAILAGRNWTQKYLATDEGIASWTPISKFFNGKPVDRTIFIDICQRLDLHWEDIAASESVDDGDDDSELNAMTRSAIGTRRALAPRILDRIEREIVRSKFMPSIERGTLEADPHIVPLIGPAGYGKSTILGNIYDLLVASGTPWVGLILCASLTIETPTVESLDRAFAIGAGCQSDSICTAADRLNAQYGRGALLIDTLDLVVNRPFITALQPLLENLVESGTTIVFTCRDREYSDFLEPVRQKLPALVPWFYRYNVPEFSDDEVREAAVAFASKHSGLDRGASFADRVLSLSADSRPLQEITRNPLLLALLCDLFAKDGTVPRDLTVSKLYRRYWDEKVTYSRSEGSRTSFLALEKERFCLHLTRWLFDRSRDRLQESVYLDELDIEVSPTVASAYDDLLSEGVIEQLPNGKIHFFHQTLLEYAIAYWLTRDSARNQRDRLLGFLATPEGESAGSYWWPSVRQLLSIVDDGEFETIENVLGIERVPAFRAVSFAAAARETARALERLFPIALAAPKQQQDIFRQALASAAVPLMETAWSMVVVLLENGERSVASSAAQACGDLLVAGETSISQKLEEALAAIDRRGETGKHQERLQLSGWLVDELMARASQGLEPEILRVLARYYRICAEGSRIKIVELHLMPGTERDCQRELRDRIFAEPMPKRLSENLARLLGELLAATFDPDLSGSQWLERLHDPLKPGLEVVQARAVGRCIPEDEAAIAAIIDDCLEGVSRRLHLNFFALREASEQGGGPAIARQVLGLPQPPPEQSTPLVEVVKAASPGLTGQESNRLAAWCEPLARALPSSWVSAILSLAEGCPWVGDLLVELMQQLPVAEQAKYTGRTLLEALPDLDKRLPHLVNEPALQVARIDRFCERGQTDEEALQSLVALATQNKQKTAQAAARALEELSKEREFATLEPLLALSTSRFAGVRLAGLDALLNHPMERIDSFLFECWLRALAEDDDRKIIQQLCSLICEWVRCHGTILPVALHWLEALPERLDNIKQLDAGTTGTFVKAANAVAQLHREDLADALAEATRQLLLRMDFRRIKQAKAIDLLAAIARPYPNILTEIVEGDFDKLPPRNQQAIALAVRRVEGDTSPLLDRVLAHPDCDGTVANTILGWKGA